MASVEVTLPPGRVDVEVDVFAAILALQVEQLHHQFVGVAVVDFALQEDDAILQQQIAQRHLALALVVLRIAAASCGSKAIGGKRSAKGRCVLFMFNPLRCT